MAKNTTETKSYLPEIAKDFAMFVGAAMVVEGLHASMKYVTTMLGVENLLEDFTMPKTIDVTPKK